MIDMNSLEPVIYQLFNLLLPFLLAESVFHTPKVTKAIEQKWKWRWLLLLVSLTGMAIQVSLGHRQVQTGAMLTFGIVYLGVSFLRVASLESSWSKWVSRYCTVISMCALLLSWGLQHQSWMAMRQFVLMCSTDLRTYMIILGFIWVTVPCASIVKYAVGKLGHTKRSEVEKEPNGEEGKTGTNTTKDDSLIQAGFAIGIFERLIILALVLLKEYAAIGFLITGKSLLRMNSKGQTEYVLAGTLLSYALAILTGALINWQFGH